eukprot:CAMPEP_0179342450 /NCGR_PEP_ID=MMETSP0797-20121207/70411_1 /TAXON_ID=47934 /ORGANISM="Dinophysis acuminata, Strain DAEP01" /LENGTH=71 /DNA_ID=CAMNT_0021056661 /DNA_START=81 /DNA_END=293 /DNA_ORIENTATION=+
MRISVNHSKETLSTRETTLRCKGDGKSASSFSTPSVGSRVRERAVLRPMARSALWSFAFLVGTASAPVPAV